MKLHLDQPLAQNTVTAYGPGFVEVNRVRYRGSLLLLPARPAGAWLDDDRGFDALRAADFDRLLPLRPDLVLLGTGTRQRFPQPALTAPLRAAGIGVEVMDTGSACRTYNILVGEGRSVAAALLIEPA